MKVHHLNCGTMNPITGRHVCHVLLIETDNSLVLVDSGFGTADIADPAHRIGPVRHLIKPALIPDETALHQIEHLGFRRDDVRHIIATHLDFDHIGGISDFPDAHVHTTSIEALGARFTKSTREQLRYRRPQLDHDVKFVEHDPNGEKWRGFAAAKELTEIADGIVLLALPGHTRGHACVAVDTGPRWILHAGDAFFDPHTVDGAGRPNTVLAISEMALAHNRKQVRDNHSRLAELNRRGDADLLIVNAHSGELLAHAQDTATSYRT